jgi:hypothetical protein
MEPTYLVRIQSLATAIVCSAFRKVVERAFVCRRGRCTCVRSAPSGLTVSSEARLEDLAWQHVENPERADGEYRWLVACGTGVFVGVRCGA